MAADVGNEDVIVLVDAQSVGSDENLFTPGAKILALRIEYQEGIGVFASLDNIDIPAGIDGRRRDSAKFPACGKCVFWLLGELNIYAVLKQTAFMRIPALLSRDRGHGAQHERGCLEVHVFDSNADS